MNWNSLRWLTVYGGGIRCAPWLEDLPYHADTEGCLSGKVDFSKGSTNECPQLE